MELLLSAMGPARIGPNSVFTEQSVVRSNFCTSTSILGERSSGQKPDDHPRQSWNRLRRQFALRHYFDFEQVDQLGSRGDAARRFSDELLAGKSGERRTVSPGFRARAAW